MIDIHEPDDLQTLVRDKIDAWHAGQTPDASKLLAEFPALRKSKSLVLDLALAEYEVRTAAGDEIAKSDFCNRFPAYRQSLSRLLEVHEYLDQCPQFAVNDATRWPAPGDEFLGFEIVEPLGRGGLARVFLARQPELGNRQVVIKVSRFASREANTLGKLSHPSIMPVFSVDHDNAGDWTVICMPLLGAATGVDLLDAAFGESADRNAALVHRVARETRPLAASSAVATEELAWNLTYPQAIARLGLQLSEALAAAHAAGILHRDIKPSNVLLAWSGRPILLDFNLSSDAAASVQGIGGTLAYMAPELLASVLTDKGHNARQFDPRYDIYSLGAVLFELLTGQLPSRPENAERLPLDAYEPWLECKRQPPIQLFADIEQNSADASLQEIVLQCLSVDPAERFATAAELAAALRDYIVAATPVVVSDQAAVQVLPVAQPSVNRNRRAVLAAATGLAGLGLVGTGLGLMTYFNTRQVPLNALYQQALEEYEAGKYNEAVATFTRCLERKSGWHDALFGRAQALRKVGKWREARTDYTALRDANPAWAFSFAGYCDLLLNDYQAAETDLTNAYDLGQRDISFLFNLAKNQTLLQRHSKVVQIYGDILEIEPQNLIAMRNRAFAGLMVVINQKKLLPSDECFADAAAYCNLAGESYEGPLVASMVFGEAARKDKRYEAKAVEYFTDAIKKGFPVEGVAALPAQLKPLLSRMEASIIEAATHDAKYRLNFAVPVQEYSNTASWERFLQTGKVRPAAVVRGR
jgi:serine/threonine protein kinase